MAEVVYIVNDTGFHHNALPAITPSDVTEYLGNNRSMRALTSPDSPFHETLDARAAQFVSARLTGRSLSNFPGQIPADLEAGYACQDAAIARWPDTIAGWKVGYIAPERRDSSGDDRLVGPIFSRSVWFARVGQVLEFPVFIGGFAAVEAEYVFRLGQDAKPGKTDWSAAEAAELVSSLHIGIETAGSPLASINVLGPTVVVSDFGNNAGLIMGPEISDWRNCEESSLICETFIEGVSVGLGGAASVPGGLLAALAFALNRCARRNLPITSGSLITTGAATGIHDIRVGQHARISFGNLGAIECFAVAAAAVELEHE